MTPDGELAQLRDLPNSLATLPHQQRRGLQSLRKWAPSSTVILLLPALGFLAFFFIYPILELLLTSARGPEGWTSQYFGQALGETTYLRVYAITLELAAQVTVLTLVLAYPVAYLLSAIRPRIATVLLAFVLLPFFTSLLVRMFAWMVLLGPVGFLSRVAEAFGLEAPQLLYNRTGVLIGMTYSLLPYMVLTLYSVMRGIDRSLLRAAYGLGANNWHVFKRVVFPLTLPGTVGGCLLVFILALGYFITPALMGGPRDQTIASVIVSEVELTTRWNFAAALSVLLLGVTLVGFGLASRLIRLGDRFESRT